VSILNVRHRLLLFPPEICFVDYILLLTEYESGYSHTHVYTYLYEHKHVYPYEYYLLRFAKSP
jgi:hypothetical protein